MESLLSSKTLTRQKDIQFSSLGMYLLQQVYPPFPHFFLVETDDEEIWK